MRALWKRPDPLREIIQKVRPQKIIKFDEPLVHANVLGCGLSKRRINDSLIAEKPLTENIALVSGLTLPR